MLQERDAKQKELRSKERELKKLQLQALEKAKQEELEVRFTEESKKVANEEAEARRKLMIERLRQKQEEEAQVSKLVLTLYGRWLKMSSLRSSELRRRSQILSLLSRKKSVKHSRNNLPGSSRKSKRKSPRNQVLISKPPAE